MCRGERILSSRGKNVEFVGLDIVQFRLVQTELSALVRLFVYHVQNNSRINKEEFPK